jgi:hypothetical protein
MSEIGTVLKLDLTFGLNTVPKYLNATNSALLWAGTDPQTLISAACQPPFVFFGSKSPSGQSFILRLNISDDDPVTRFRSTGPAVPGDLPFVGAWGSKTVMFAMEPEGEMPLTFVQVTSDETGPIVEVEGVFLFVCLFVCLFCFVLFCFVLFCFVCFVCFFFFYLNFNQQLPREYKPSHL